MLSLMLCAMILVAPGEELNVIDEGAGPPVLLVPGLSGSAYCYRLVTPLLQEAGLRTIVVDPLAMGDSARPENADYTLTAQGHRLAAVLDSLGVDQAVVVAHGVSVSMVLRMALDRPDLVAGIVSLEGGPVESALTPAVQSGLKMAKLVNGLGGKRMIRDHYADKLRRASVDDSWVDKTTVRKYFRGPMRDMGGTIDALVAMSRQAEPDSVTPRLPDLAVPMVLMLGDSEHEGALADEHRLAFEENLADLTITLVPDAGHFLMEERPEAVARAVADLSAAVASDAPSPR